MAPHHRDQVLLTGVLFKKSSGADYPFGRRNWNTRYFVLTPSALKYYNYEGGAWKGEVDLGAKNKKTKELITTIDVMPSDCKKTGSSASTIWRIAINSNNRRLLVSASSEMEMNRWAEQLQLALDIAMGRFAGPHTRMSLLDNLMTGGNSFIVDFPSVTAPRQRMSIGAFAERNSIQQSIHDFRVLAASSSSISLPRGATYDARDSDDEFKSDDASSSESLITYGVDLNTPPSRRQVYYSGRQSLPSTSGFQDFTSALPPKSIADFNNFSRSRRRMSLDSGVRLRRSLNMGAQLPNHVQYPGSEGSEGSEETSAQPMEKRGKERRRWRRFARFREWFSRH